MTVRPWLALLVIGEAVVVTVLLVAATHLGPDRRELEGALLGLVFVVLLGTNLPLALLALEEWSCGFLEQDEPSPDPGQPYAPQGDLDRLTGLKRRRMLFALAARVRDSAARGARYLLARPREPAVPATWRGGPEAPLAHLVRLKRRGDFKTPGGDPDCA